MSVSETVVTNRQDPAIEAYRLGLLQDVQGFTGGQIFGQNVQNLRKQGLSDQQISERLSTAATGRPSRFPRREFRPTRCTV
mgnify:CR=1 FL=1